MSCKLEKDVAWESSTTGTLYKQLLVHPKPIPSTMQLAGKTAIFTGANTGLGFEAAQQLLQLGTGDAAARKLQEEFPSAKVDVSIVKLSDYESITAFTRRCQSLERIDYAVLNAGQQTSSFERNEKTGHESVFQTNYLSTALLVMLLASTMKEKQHYNERGKPPVLTVVGADTMYFNNFKISGPIFPRMDNQTRYSKMQQYLESKLLLMMFISQLVEHISPEDVIINVCNSGLTAGTSLGQDVEKPGFVARWFAPLFVNDLGRSLEVGASVYIHALVMEGQESHGSFVSDWEIKPYPALMYKKEGRSLMERLWRETIQELGSVSDLGVDTLFISK